MRMMMEAGDDDDDNDDDADDIFHDEIGNQDANDDDG